MPIPNGLQAVGTRDAEFEAVARVQDVPAGTLLRVTRGDLDLLIAHTPAGLCAIDDRCPHMSAPLSLGTLEDCVVGCPLHRGKFDLSSGAVVQFPTTGGLDSEGEYHATWTPTEAAPKPEPRRPQGTRSSADASAAAALLPAARHRRPDRGSPTALRQSRRGFEYCRVPSGIANR